MSRLVDLRAGYTATFNFKSTLTVHQAAVSIFFNAISLINDYNLTVASVHGIIVIKILRNTLITNIHLGIFKECMSWHRAPQCSPSRRPGFRDVLFVIPIDKAARKSCLSIYDYRYLPLRNQSTFSTVHLSLLLSLACSTFKVSPLTPLGPHSLSKTAHLKLRRKFKILALFSLLFRLGQGESIR